MAPCSAVCLPFYQIGFIAAGRTTDTRLDMSPSFPLCPSFQGSPTKKLAKEGGPPKLSRGLSPLPLSFEEKEKKPQIRACVSRPKIEGPPIPTYWASVHQVLVKLLSDDLTISCTKIITSDLQIGTKCDEFDKLES